MKKLFSVACTSFLLVSSPIQASSDNVVLYFMETAASMFDIGMLRLECHLEALEHDGLLDDFDMVMATYDWEDDKLRLTALSGFGAPSTVKSTEKAEAACSAAFTQLRQLCGVEAPGEIGMTISEAFGYSLCAQNFAHEGFEVEGQSERLAQLDNKFELVCEVYLEDMDEPFVMSEPLIFSN